MNLEFNNYQSKVDDEILSKYPDEVKEQFFDFINNVEFIKWLVSKDRPYAKDCPHDDKGRVIVDLAHPHILQDMDYFRQPALHYMKHGCYTFLKPNSNPHSEYRKFWDEEIRRCLEGYVRESDGEWITGYCYWFLNYNPMMVNIIKEGSKRATRIESFPFFFEGIYWRFHYIDQARNAGKHCIELARRGAHPYFQKVFTPNGWTTWENINIGDYLYGTTGELVKVTDIPFDKEAPYYKITFRDGREVYASDDHLWNVKIPKYKEIKTLTTLELLGIYKTSRKVSYRMPTGIEYKVKIPIHKCIQLQYKKTLIDPYTFGLLLGDGCFKHKACYFSQGDSDMEEMIKDIPYEVTKWTSKCAYGIHIQNWKKFLKIYNLDNVGSKDKFIPEEYKYNSKEVRLSLLQGLMDTDGCAQIKRAPYFNTTSKKLAKDIMEVSRSLGYNCSCCIKKSGYKIDGVLKECLPNYNVTIYGGKELFKLKRKQDKVEYKCSRKDWTFITDITYIGNTKCKCVTVDAEDSCYLIGDFITTHNCAKSYTLSSILTHNLILGENQLSKKRVMTVLAAYQKEYLKDDKDGTLSKFRPSINFIAENTPFPVLMLKNSPNEMSWQMGYKDEFGRDCGSLNTVMGVAIKDDEAKLRGKRGIFLFEEMGTMPNLLTVYDTCRRSVEDGDYTFGQMFLVGTANESEADFSSAKTLLYNPEGYNIYSIKNVFDKPKQGKANFGFFFPAYINRAGCYNRDGVSDVTKALLEILMARFKSKYSSDPQSVLRVIAEDPITPAEAIIKVKAAYFPTAALNERLAQLDQDPNAYSDVYVGDLVLRNGEVAFTPTTASPIHKYGVDNSTVGAIEIFEMPAKNREGEVFTGRYIVGHDPVDNDQAESSSLSSTFVFDLYTDKIVAEYTGRQPFADDNFEIVRKLCIFYNAKCLFEAHAYSEIVPTPEGFKQWKDIKIGDTLFSPTKGTVKVIDIPVDTMMPIYKITLIDGRVITASDRHIWSLYYRDSKELRNLTTEQMLKFKLKNDYGQHTLFLPEGNGVEYNHKNLPIDPYTFGLILAEGSIVGSHCTKNNIQISSSMEDMEFYKGEIPYECEYVGTKGYSWHIRIKGCKDIMTDLKLLGTNSHTKFIPDLYKYSDRVQRFNLLQGLMDGDGCAKTNGTPIFVTASKQLALDIMSLARSLGMKSWIQGTNNNSYRVCIASIYKIFKLPRKVVNQHIYNPYTKGSKASAILSKTAIEKIELSHNEMGKCVTVDSEDGLYYINDYVITHNSNKKGLYAYMAKMSCIHYLAETPVYLREKQLIKYSNFGSNRFGVNASAAINDYANNLLRDWLLKPTTIHTKQSSGEMIEENIPMLYTIRNRAFLEELALYTPEINVDRIRAMGMVMLYRQEKIILYQGDMRPDREESYNSAYLGNDKFFINNYDKRVNLAKI